MKYKSLAAACRWTARILGLLLVSFIVIIAVGEGMPNPLTQTWDVQIGFLALGVLMLGTLAGWRWEFFGGALSLAGWCLFVAAVVWLKHMTLFVFLLALPGILYLASARLTRNKKGQIP